MQSRRQSLLRNLDACIYSPDRLSKFNHAAVGESANLFRDFIERLAGKSRLDLADVDEGRGRRFGRFWRPCWKWLVRVDAAIVSTQPSGRRRPGFVSNGGGKAH